MFSVTIPLFLLSLAPTLTFGEKCALCTGFDESLTIDIAGIISGVDMGGDGSQRSGNGRRGRFLQSVEYMLSSCADLKTDMSSLDSDSLECAMYSTIAYGSCGCTDDPPAGSCYSCPFGGTFNKDTVPDLPAMGEDGPSMPSGATCGERALSLDMTKTVLDALEGAFGGSQTTFESGGMDIEDIDFCGMIRSPCGCKPHTDPDACTICEFGLKNPDFKPDIEGNEDDQFTCAQAVQMTEQIIVNEGLCDEAKEGAVKGGCVCKTSAAVNKNIVTLLVISAATTMLAFLG